MADRQGLVSIIVPVYNIEKQIGRCLHSITSQTYSNLEIILIDDGSTDQSLNECQKIADFDSRIRLFHHDNHGVSFTRNRGITESKGDFILFVDGDDEIAANMVEQYVLSFEADTDLVVGGITIVEKTGTCHKIPVTGVFNQKELIDNVCNDTSGIYGYAPNKMYRSKVIKSNNIFFREDMSAQEDLEFALSVYAVARCVCCIDNTGYYYYHPIAKRNMPVKALLENQIKLYGIACSAGSELRGVVQRIQNVVYTTIIRAEKITDITSMYDIPELLECLMTYESTSIEKRFLMSSFVKHKPGILYLYSIVRKRVKQVLQRETV